MIVQNFIIASEAVAPMFIIMAIGVFVRRRGMVTEGDVKRMNKLIFNVYGVPFAAPCAVSSYTMAQQMDSDAELAGNTVIFSSLLSCLTMFL